MFKHFTDLDFSASTAIQTDEKESVAIENIARKIYNKQEKAVRAALTAYDGVSSDNIYRVVAISRKSQKKVIAYMGSSAIEATDAFELLKNNEGFMKSLRVRLERLEPVIIDEARKLS